VTSDSVMPGEGECEGGTLTNTQVDFHRHRKMLTVGGAVDMIDFH